MLKWLAPLALIVTIAPPAWGAEVCGNGLDDDANNLADEGCYPTLTTGQCESPLSCEDTGMVSPSTGSMKYSLPPDIAPKVPYGPGIGLRRFYLSMYAPASGAPTYRTSMGDRWGHTYMTWLDDVSNGGPTKLILHTNRGQDILLNKTSADATWEYFTPQPGFHFKHVRRRLAAPNETQIRQLTGEVTVYDGSGKLIEIWDTLATPNKVLVAHDGNGRLSTVTDASGKRRLLFGGYVNDRITSIAFQIYVNAAWTTYHTTTYAYTNGHPTTVTIGGALAHTNVYANGYLTAINDAAGTTIASFAYDATTPGKVVRVDTSRGTIGWETASSRSTCAAKTVLYFNRGNALTCNVDADCGSGFLCGGKTGGGSTGMCFRAARCLTVASPSEDVVTSVTALGPPSETCDGTCLDAAQYIWNTGTGVLDLKAVQDPSGNYTARLNNANGLPWAMSFADPDANVYSSSAPETRWMEFSYDANFPGRVTEVLRASELYPRLWGCSSSATYECARTAYTYNADGLLTSITQSGTTLDISNALVPYSSTTSSEQAILKVVLEVGVVESRDRRIAGEVVALDDAALGVLGDRDSVLRGLAQRIGAGDLADEAEGVVHDARPLAGVDGVEELLQPAAVVVGHLLAAGDGAARVEGLDLREQAAGTSRRDA